jgi:hypothetical protein
MKKKSFWGMIVVLIMLFGLFDKAYAVVLDFEGVPTSEFPFIPNGYGGLNWDNMIFTNKDMDPGLYNESLPWYSGIRYGIVSGTQLARNNMANPTTIYSNPGEYFDFNSAYFTSARQHNMFIDVIGFRDGTQIYDKMITVDTYSATNFVFDYKSIDKLYIASYGGTPDLTKPDTYFHDFLMDDFNYSSPVPEPSSLLMTMIGIYFLVMARRRKIYKGMF